MGWKVAGWLVFVWGLAGLIANIVFVIIQGPAPGPLINSFVCIAFIWGGWTLSHRKPKAAKPTPTSPIEHPRSPLP